MSSVSETRSRIEMRPLKSIPGIWTVLYVKEDGSKVTIGKRRRTYHDALMTGAAHARIHGVQLEIEPWDGTR